MLVTRLVQAENRLLFLSICRCSPQSSGVGAARRVTGSRTKIMYPSDKGETVFAGPPPEGHGDLLGARRDPVEFGWHGHLWERDSRYSRSVSVRCVRCTKCVGLPVRNQWVCRSHDFRLGGQVEEMWRSEV
jgi:hypothetical protein